MSDCRSHSKLESLCNIYLCFVHFLCFLHYLLSRLVDSITFVFCGLCVAIYILRNRGVSVYPFTVSPLTFAQDHTHVSQNPSNKDEFPSLRSQPHIFKRRYNECAGLIFRLYQVESFQFERVLFPAL